MISDLSFIIFNWIELAILIYMVYLIKDIKEGLNIKNELIAIATLYFILSITLALGYMAKNMYLKSDNGSVDMIFFIIILSRNFVRLFIEFCCCFK